MILEGDVPIPGQSAFGLPLPDALPDRQAVCAESRPEFRELKPGHFVACHFADQFV